MRKRPLATKMATCLIGFGAGDLVAQTLQFAKAPQLPEMPKRQLLAELDYGRVARMACFGALVAAPQMHIFFTWLDKVVMPLTPKSPLAVFSKVCIDQMLNSPLGTASFFTWTQAMQGRPENAIPEIADKLWPTTQVAWRLWPIAQAVNFVMVPTHLRVIFINAVAIFWTTILSGIGN